MSVSDGGRAAVAVAVVVLLCTITTVSSSPCQSGWTYFVDAADLEGRESCILLATNVTAINATGAASASFFKKANAYCAKQNTGALLLSLTSSAARSSYSMQTAIKGA